MKQVTIQDHLVTTNEYDDQTLRLVRTTVVAEHGWRLNGHRADCRCLICRPDIVRLAPTRY